MNLLESSITSEVSAYKLLATLGKKVDLLWTQVGMKYGLVNNMTR